MANFAPHNEWISPDGPGRLDWRTDSKRLVYSPICLPAATRTGILDMLWRLGLVYAAVDLIVDRAGTHWLVDVNPGGQWAWIDCTRDVIGSALADLLQKGSS